MARGGHGGGNKHVCMSEVYERKEETRDEQLTAPLQRLEEQIGQFEQFGEQISAQIGALAEQFAAIGGPNSRRHQPNPCFVVEEDESSVYDELVNPFAWRRAGGVPRGAKQ